MEHAELAKHLRDWIEHGLATNIFPGAVLDVRRGGDVVISESFGYAEIKPNPRQMQSDHLFDVASLTKVMATLPAILRSIALQKLELERQVADYLPEWGSQEGSHPLRATVTLKQVLTHTSGLPAWRPFYIQYASSEEYLNAICREPLGYAPGTQVVYSDLGFLLLGLLLERVWKKDLPSICRELVFEQLGLQQTGYLPQVPRSSIVATEIGNDCERQMSLEYARECVQQTKQTQQTLQLPPSHRRFTITEQQAESHPWRTSTLCGEVHDCNAHFGLQGVSGHAGLFSSRSDVVRYAEMWRKSGDVDGQVFLSPELWRLATQNHTQHLNYSRGLGFETGSRTCSAGPHASTEAFGHTGFTGTSLWVDPATDTQVVVLTNRVHPSVKPGIVDWRKRLHHIAFS